MISTKVDFSTFPVSRHSDKDKFPFGIWIYEGAQGSGKTLSMVYDLKKYLAEFPDIFVLSNVKLFIDGLSSADIRYFSTVDELLELLPDTALAKHSVVILDEGLSYFAENGGINPALMSSITQNRKARRLFMVSCQKYSRLNNRLRDFANVLVKCSGHLCGIVQVNLYMDNQKVSWDRESLGFVGEPFKRRVFKRNDDLFHSYDTFQKIDITKNVSDIFEGKSPPSDIFNERSNKWTKKIRIK